MVIREEYDLTYVQGDASVCLAGLSTSYDGIRKTPAATAPSSEDKVLRGPGVGVRIERAGVANYKLLKSGDPELWALITAPLTDGGVQVYHPQPAAPAQPTAQPAAQ